MTFSTLLYAFLGGLLPSLVWLYFLLKEDAKHPEPKRLIVFTFALGMLAVPIALFLEQFVKSELSNIQLVLIGWALIEEVLKYAMVALFVLWRRAVDEPPDYVIYMITVALGFAALENMLFLLTPLMNGNFVNGFFTGNVRFLTSTLLHVIASATIGFALGFSEFKQPLIRMLSGAFGLILAVALHTGFNMLIINNSASNTLTAFFFVWTGAVIVFAVFEVLKYVQYHVDSYP